MEMFNVYNTYMKPIKIYSHDEVTVFEISFYMIIDVSFGDKDSLIELINTATKRLTKEELSEVVNQLICYKIDYHCPDTECMSIYLNFINEYRKSDNTEDIGL